MMPLHVTLWASESVLVQHSSVSLGLGTMTETWRLPRTSRRPIAVYDKSCFQYDTRAIFGIEEPFIPDPQIVYLSRCLYHHTTVNFCWWLSSLFYSIVHNHYDMYSVAVGQLQGVNSCSNDAVQWGFPRENCRFGGAPRRHHSCHFSDHTPAACATIPKRVKRCLPYLTSLHLARIFPLPSFCLRSTHTEKRS